MKLLEAMKNPPREYSPAAFWFWYGDLEPEQLRQQIRMMVEQGVYNGFMHARAYLKTPYLGEDWWKAIAACIADGSFSQYVATALEQASGNIHEGLLEG